MNACFPTYRLLPLIKCMQDEDLTKLSLIHLYDMFGSLGHHIDQCDNRKQRRLLKNRRRQVQHAFNNKPIVK